MWIFSFYRFYISLALGIAASIYFLQSLWLGLGGAVLIRFIIFSFEFSITRSRMNRDFKECITAFKQEFGPYGIRIANKAEKDWMVRKSLAEVFTSNTSKLKKTVDQLEVMDALFRSGMRPEGDEFLIHDLKLKFGKKRLEELQK